MGLITYHSKYFLLESFQSVLLAELIQSDEEFEVSESAEESEDSVDDTTYFFFFFLVLVFLSF